MASPGSMIIRGVDVQEFDCDVCKLLSKILHKVERIEQRLSRLEQSYPQKGYDPVWMELETRIGNTYQWPYPGKDGSPDRFVVGEIVWGGPDQLNQWVAMDNLNEDRWATLGVIKELEEHTHQQNWRMRS